MMGIYVTLIAIFLILAGISAYFSVKGRMLWKNDELNALKANSIFLHRNFLLFFMGALVSGYLFLESIDVYGLPFGLAPYWQQISMFYIVLPVVSMLFLHKLLSSPK